jgi:diguanylate cyclase (GGDEF)-like protein
MVGFDSTKGLTEFDLLLLEHSALGEMLKHDPRLRKLLYGIWKRGVYDPLTELYNKRSFDEQMISEIRAVEENTKNARHGERTKPFSLTVYDMTLKPINDKYGHAAGNWALQQVADALRSTYRMGDDFIARIGGDEFAVIQPEIDLSSAYRIARNLSTKLSRVRVSDETPIEIDYGVSEWQPGLTCSDMFNAADALMYAHKDKRVKERTHNRQ